MLKVSKSVRIGIGKNRFRVNRSNPTDWKCELPLVVPGTVVSLRGIPSEEPPCNSNWASEIRVRPIHLEPILTDTDSNRFSNF